LKVKEKFDNEFDEIVRNNTNLFEYNTQEISLGLELYCEDFLKINWEKASFIFANSTCFSDGLYSAISRKAEEMSKGSFLVTLTKKLPSLSSNWQIQKGFKQMMSWGVATVYVHYKIY